jgi:hypothetical protein
MCKRMMVFALLMCTHLLNGQTVSAQAAVGCRDAVCLKFLARDQQLQPGKPVVVTYRVENKSRSDIFVVRGEQAFVADVERCELVVNLTKAVVNFYDIKLPSFAKIKPGHIFSETVTLAWPEGTMDLQRGQWQIDLLVGCLDKEGMSILNQFNRKHSGTVPQIFAEAQQVLISKQEVVLRVRE